MLNKAFPNNAPKRTTVFEWHSRFKAGRISIEDDPRQGRPTFQRTDENVQKITDLIKENPRTTLLELEQDTGISKTTIGRIVTEDLRLKKTPAKFIPRFLTNEQKLCRLATCEDMLEMTRTDPEWKDKIITGDETWVYGYDPETKRQSAEWRGQGEPRPKKSRILKSRNKVLLVAFLDNKGIVHHEYLPASQTVIKEMYLSILRRLREAIRKKRPEKWTNGDWILHHDNARPHTAHLVFWIVFDFYLLKKMDQRTCIKFCVKNEIKCADAFRMLTVAYGEATLDRSNVYRWYKMFSEGREDVNDEERAGRPSTSTTDEKINEVEKMILANRRITVREVAEDLNISIGSCHSIFINDLGMRRVAAKFVPKLLNCDQKQHRMNIANEMFDSVRDDPNLLQRVITGDEAWVYGYDVETKAQSSQWKLPHAPRPKKARQVRSNVKVLLTVFFDCRGVVHHEFLPQGRTVNKEYYLQVVRNLREAIRQKRPDLWKYKNWLLHHDNAPAHTSLLVRDLLTKNNTLMMPQPPYSPDLAPCDFFLFPKLKRPMKGRRYATLDEIKTALKEELKKIFF
ncbi:hypothetical protein LAZ67_12000310 [Cordylochernes scorpioides]|uniref:Mos1 transposase HTH domain-containing protein n=1 Tax=Cordylochernes scorpioides TaxID=51811 RepID=A0ABY6L0G1_9ARAC|nr:hypothetical protein LAZ67_12000310 [Cordylochernes scorpioides]